MCERHHSDEGVLTPPPPQPGSPAPPCLYVWGLVSTGKSLVLTTVLRVLKVSGTLGGRGLMSLSSFIYRS